MSPELSLLWPASGIAGSAALSGPSLRREKQSVLCEFAASLVIVSQKKLFKPMCGAEEMAKWLRALSSWLLLQRTWVQIPRPHKGCSQWPTASVVRDPVLSSGLYWALDSHGAHTYIAGTYI